MATPLRRPDVVDLDGRWAFRLLDRPEAVTVEDLVGPTDGWAAVEVPGCWTMQDVGDRPHYTNLQMPFPGPPPHVPEANPTGVHRCTLDLPASWRGQRIVLHVGAAESVLYVHVDGRPVGMGKDSRLPQEYDLTGIVEPGVPAELALTVVRWSDATYLEDQDHWHHAGLHRSVACYATPPVHIADLVATADLDPGPGTGHLDLRVPVGVPAGERPKGWRVRATVAGRSAEAEVHVEHPTEPHVNWMVFEGRGARLSLELPGVAPWTAETPALHDLTVALLDAEGREVDVVGRRIGFRRVEVRGHELLVNGRAVLIKGVNRHDHDVRRGKAMTPEAIEADVVAMKRHNINAVRTSHYPADSHLYDVCDRLGMYVLDEANLESHAYLRSLTKDPMWTPAILERIVRMAQRDVAHPSVIMWSLGNESGTAPVLVAAAAWLRAWDPSRPVHYESGITEDRLSGAAADMPAALARPRPESDVIAPMYPSVHDIVAWATQAPPDRPLVMCEYLHAMGNSCGGAQDYWDAIRAHPACRAGSCGTGPIRRCGSGSTTAPSGSPTAATSATSPTTARSASTASSPPTGPRTRRCWSWPRWSSRSRSSAVDAARGLLVSRTSTPSSGSAGWSRRGCSSGRAGGRGRPARAARPRPRRAHRGARPAPCRWSSRPASVPT
jgi:beta-galactosidase